MERLQNIEYPSAILFDWDNTLLDSWSTIHSCLLDTLKEFGKKSFNMQETKKFVSSAKKDYIHDIFGDNANDALKFYRKCFVKHADDLVLLPGVNEMLDFLQMQDITMSIASNKHGILLRNEIDKLGLENYFNKIVGAGDVLNDKPARDPVDMAMPTSLYAREKVWFVGDSVIDMECAYVSGCVPVLYNLEDGEYDSTYKPVAIVHDHMDLIKLLQSFDK
ncbi:phosphoglycolate phosphatase [Candidatus Xenohaliotis californiensis]|uniref:phosphoglycolate phosphatase n=1 Tax=Candidatus Xenohaliotis californiensis TaxID=84677 RepID=A0ABP0EU10_9RICK|nr:phosphoglycolate phosphatase [Candidatus Xenohaliotis californiensis]